MSREHPLAPHRLLPVAVIVLLGLVALLAVKGPDWYQRFYRPLYYEQAIEQNATANGLDPYLVAALINVESGFDATDVSARGAVGLMQLMPATAEEVARDSGLAQPTDAESLKDPDVNIRIGTLHLASLKKQFFSTDEVLAAYNAGSGRVERWRRSAAIANGPFLDAIEYSETRRYVDDVLSQRDSYARLYPDAFGGAAK